MIELIQAIVPLILMSNWAMTGIKFLADESASRAWLRAMLALIALVGAFASASLTGQPVDVDSISSLGRTLALALIVTIGSHFSYKIMKAAPGAAE